MIRPSGSDIFAAQAVDPDQLAEVYDLEHDAVTEDLAFYRELAGGTRGAVLDLGCGSGRLFGSFLEGRASRIVGVDGSPAMLRRALRRVEGRPPLARALAEGRLELMLGDVRSVRRPERFGLIVAAGVLPHLDGPEDALRLLAGAARLLTPRGLLVLDDLGPAALPATDQPLAVDWRRRIDGRSVVRRSRVVRREAPEGLRIAFSTITDAVQPDGTIARLPAGYRLWYPSMQVLVRLVATAGLALAGIYGSHDLEAFGATSARLIVMARRVRRRATRGPDETVEDRTRGERRTDPADGGGGRATGSDARPVAADRAGPDQGP